MQICAGAPQPKDDGYRGIWYYNQATKDEYKYKYSGGMATYPQQHAPIAIYSPQANKTFFCYGGTIAREGKGAQSFAVGWIKKDQRARGSTCTVGDNGANDIVLGDPADDGGGGG